MKTSSIPETEMEYPAIAEGDAVTRVIEKPDGTKVTIFASGAVVVRRAGGAPVTRFPDGRIFITARENGLVEDVTPKSALPPEKRPLNVFSHSAEDIGRQLSNFAERRFVLDGRSYLSVEGWYQGLKWPEKAKRAEIAKFSGSRAKNAAKGAPKAETFLYEDETVAFGSAEHHALVKRAIRASLEQSPEVRAAFVATHPRPIVHTLSRPERPGTALPARKFAAILEEVRAEFVAEDQGAKA